MKNLILTSILLILIVTTGYLIYDNLPGELRKFDFDYNSETQLPADISAKSEITQFVPNMRFNHNNLTYSFKQTCGMKDIADMKKAFSVIQTKTGIITFKEISQRNNENADIEITCSEEEFKSSSNTFVAGEGGPTEFYNNTIYPIIIKGTIKLYKPQYETQKCEDPLVEIHELLHVFGFEHYNKTDSIMYPYLSCSQEIGEEYIQYLKQLYSIEPKSELRFEKVSATKEGKYLNFEISISNKGIIMSEDVKIKLTNNNNLIKEFDLDSVEVATTKTLKAENIKLPSRNTDDIEFRIETSTKEYDVQNNIVELQIDN